jgi:hypothetical protein
MRDRRGFPEQRQTRAELVVSLPGCVLSDARSTLDHGTLAGSSFRRHASQARNGLSQIPSAGAHFAGCLIGSSLPFGCHGDEPQPPARTPFRANLVSVFHHRLFSNRGWDSNPWMGRSYQIPREASDCMGGRARPPDPSSAPEPLSHSGTALPNFTAPLWLRGAVRSPYLGQVYRADLSRRSVSDFEPEMAISRKCHGLIRLTTDES